MPSTRRLKAMGLVALLTVCVILYITNGASSTHNSAFYTSTLAAINNKHLTKSQDDVLASEKQRLQRVERLQKEHNAAISVAAAAQETRLAHPPADTEMQQPLGQKPSASKASHTAPPGEKSVAGRKYMKDGKVVQFKATENTGDDGVAKVGNIGPHSSHAAVEKEASDDDHKVESALNEILRKSPIIIFSKTYCPFSKKAKHILLDLYNISPAPYVVELDEHELGQGLQAALEKTTGRHTVPNILINGKSIGGGDDVEKLHHEDKIVSTINSMVGKRMSKVEKKPEEPQKAEMKFKA